MVIVPLILFGLLALTLVKGNSKFDSLVGIDQCSALDFGLLSVIVSFLIISTIINIVLVKREYRIKVAHNYKFVDGDMHWTPKSLVSFIVAAVGAGSVAGTFGLGGGIIFKPLLLSFKVSPVVAASTGMYMIMFTTFSNSIIFILSGDLQISYGLWCAAWVVIGSTYGIKKVNALVQKTGRTSYVAFILVFVMVLSAIVIPVYGTITMLKDTSGIFTFGSYC